MRLQRHKLFMLRADFILFGAHKTAKRGDGICDTLRAAAHFAVKLLRQAAHQLFTQRGQLLFQFPLGPAAAGGQDEQPNRGGGNTGQDAGDIYPDDMGGDGNGDAQPNADPSQPGADDGLPG